MHEKLDEIVDLSFKEYYKAKASETISKKAITIWVPSCYKEKYDKIQGETKSQFGRDLQKMLVKAIDLVES